MFVGPIFARELLTTPRRPRHYILRVTYIGLLFVLMWTAWQAILGSHTRPRLGDIAHFNTILFRIFTVTQLGLVLFVSSLYGAIVISHEKDRRTFVLLLLTRLTDRQIVIDKFLCGLLQVSAVLVAALPVFAINVLMGGVGFEQVARAYAVMFGAAMTSGAVGVLIACWREKTFQSVAMTMVVIVLGLLAVEILGVVGEGSLVAGQPVALWCACLSPFRAMAMVIGAGPASEQALPILGHASWAYLATAAVLCASCLTIAAVKLRDWNPRGEPIQQPETGEGEREGSSPGSTSGRDPFRKVWSNPILWREVATRAYGARPVLIKAGYLLIFAILIGGLYTRQSSVTGAQAHVLVALFLLPLAILSLLLINAQAVTAVTSERDLQSMDLLLATDLTPREFVYGKLLGVFYNSKEMIAAPLVLLVLCNVWRLVGPVGLVFSIISLLVFVVFAAVLGIHAALRYESTRVSLAHSLGTMFLLFVGILLCLELIRVSGRRFEAQWASFILFIVLGSIGLWISLSANAPSNAIALTAFLAPIATFYCIIAFLQEDRVGPFLVGSGVYGFAVLALLIPMISEFDIATGRTSFEEG